MRRRIIKTWQWKVKISHSTFNHAMHVRLSTGVQRLPTVQRFAVMRSLLFMSWHSCCHSSCGPLLPCPTWSFICCGLPQLWCVNAGHGSNHILWHQHLRAVKCWCRTAYIRSDSMVWCSKCCLWLHHTCSGLSAEDFDERAQNKGKVN